MLEFNFIDSMGPRFIATVDALEISLLNVRYMRRDETPDDFAKPEAAFNICTFLRMTR